MVVREPMNYSSEITKETLPDALRACQLSKLMPHNAQVSLGLDLPRFTVGIYV